MTATELSDLTQIERRAYETIWDDGLIDLFVGLALFLIGILWATQDSAYGAFVAPILVPFWSVARKKISEPRIGIVNFSAERVTRENRKLLGLFLLGVLTLVFGVAWFFLGQHGGPLPGNSDINIVAGLPAALLAFAAIVVAFAFGIKRFLAYAAILLASTVPVIYLDLNPGWAFVPGGVCCIVAGGGLLTRFVRRYPLGG